MTLLDKYNQLRKENKELKKYLAFYRAWYCQRDYEQCKRRRPMEDDKKFIERMEEYERKNEN